MTCACRPPRGGQTSQVSKTCEVYRPNIDARTPAVHNYRAAGSITPNHQIPPRENPMPNRLRVLFLPHASPGLFKPWGEDVMAAVGERHDLRIFDRQQPMPPQFAGVDVVIDHGGSVG